MNTTPNNTETAYYVTNNAGDTVVIPETGVYYPVDRVEIFKDFFDPGEKDFENWRNQNIEDGMTYRNFGDLVAINNDEGNLMIIDQGLYEQRKNFWI